MATVTQKQFIGAVDYVVFALMLAFSAAIGFFYAYKDRHDNNMDNYHRGRRNVNPFAATLSLSVTIISATSIIGLGAEVYTYGTMILWEVVGMLVATGIAAHVYLPIFYKMDKISVFEYFELRFGKVPRTLVSLFNCLNLFIFMSFALYSPCLAFEAMTGISFWIAMAVTGCICMLYTLLGGMKAVVWADTLQFFIMVAGMICILVEGCKAVGGFGNAWDIANQHGRIELLNVSFNPTTRHTVWSLVIGFAITWSKGFGLNQATIQRACSLPSLKAAQLAMWASFPGLFLILFLAFLNGIVMFAYYHGCDPVKMGRVVKKDQMFPLFIVDIIGNIPGLSGLLLASLFSGALSSISSGFNATSAVVVEDYVKPFVRKPLSDGSQLIISKISVLGALVVCFSIAAAVSGLGGLVLQLLSTTSSLVGGPLIGCFVVGMFFPWTNTCGLYSALVISCGLTAWLAFGSLVNMPPYPALPVSTEDCISNTNVSFYVNMTQTTVLGIASSTHSTFLQTTTQYTAVEEFYRMSYLWYTPFATATFVIVALIVSFITGPKRAKNVDCRLLAPFFYKICPFLPEKYRKILLFGVDYTKKETETTKSLDNIDKNTVSVIDKNASVPCEKYLVSTTHM